MLKLGNVVPGTLEKNKKVAEHLLLISMGHSLERQPWKVRAFESAAEAVMLHPTDVSEVSNPKTIDGVGDSTAAVIVEFCKTGTSKRYQELAKKYPVEAFTMCVVDGIGPKGAIKLHESGIKNFDQLVEAARSGKLADKMKDAVLFAVGRTRVPYLEAKALAETVVNILKTRTAVHKFEVCGSIRRKAVDSKDVDIVGCVSSPTDRAAALAAFTKLGTMIKSGEDRAAIRFTHNDRTMQVDLWLVEPGSWGAALCYATGSKNHNIELRAMASKKGMLVNEFGIYEVATNRHLGGADERDLYIILGTPYVEPQDRA